MPLQSTLDDNERAQLLLKWLGKVPTIPGDIPLDVQGAVPGDIELPKDLLPLDTNRLPEDNTFRVGRNPSDLLPSRATYELDANRLPETGHLAQGSTGRPISAQAYAPPPRPSAADAIDEFMHHGTTRPTGPESVGADPALELSRLRNDRRRQLEEQTINSRSAGNFSNADRAAGFLGITDREIAADPFTGVAAQAEEAAKRKEMNTASALGNPGNPIAREQAAGEQFQLQKAAVEHPNPNVSPFAVPTAASGGTPGAAPPGTISAHGVPPPPGVKPDAWAAHTADLTPEAAAKISALLQYNEPLPSGNVMARPEWSTLIGRAMQIDPSFDYKQYGARQAYAQDFAKGQTGKAVTSLDTVMHHLGTFDQNAKNLDNSGGYPWSKSYNAAGNWLKEATVGYPEKAAFEDSANAVSGELSNVFKATGATDQEIMSWRHRLSASETPEEFQQNTTALVTLIKGRMEAIQKHYQDVMGHAAPDFLSPESRGIWNRFQSGAKPNAAALIQKYRGSGTP